MLPPMPTLPVHLIVPRTADHSVLVNGGGKLPRLDVELAEDDTVVSGLARRLRSAWGVRPVILETHVPPPPDGSEDYVALAVLEAPKDWSPPLGLEWATPTATLPDRIAPRARTWLDELRFGAAPPELRPRWARPGWDARMTDWVRASLDAAGRPAAAEIEIRRLWGISAMARIPTARGGFAWFKAVFPPFAHEVAVTRYLDQVAPGTVPHVIAADEGEGWLLLDDVGGEPLGSNASDDALANAIRGLVELQAELAGHERELRALGVPTRPLAVLADDVMDAMRDAVEIEAPDVTPDRLGAVVGWVREHSAWLASAAMPETLIHGDFHIFNVFDRHGRPVIIDWSDAAVSHPLLEIGPWFGHRDAPGDPDLAWTAWLDALGSLGAMDELRSERPRIFALAAAYQLVSYAAIVRGLEPANRYQLSDGLRHFWGLLESAVPR
jgi:aminoglycoside phosphotransferase (APT) family kinase protein